MKINTKETVQRTYFIELNHDQAVALTSQLGEVLKPVEPVVGYDEAKEFHRMLRRSAVSQDEFSWWEP